jgi:hypothetical protein
MRISLPRAEVNLLDPGCPGSAPRIPAIIDEYARECLSLQVARRIRPGNVDVPSPQLPLKDTERKKI